ncbi:MAG: glycerol-3-phosphate 1-O-acyltransferase PlsY [Limnohabitans sp.]|nr:glycerol-3-phosphate 1-O-acyltransferase PlsY [Limnohabitans sp.]
MLFLYAFMAIVLSYLIGSLSFAVVISRVMGLNDPRTYGSKNPGATNVLRSGNKLAAILTLLLDGVKGWLPVYLVQLLGPAHGLGPVTVAGVTLAAFLGHLWPVFFRFKGGKGVATAAGVLFGVDPILGLATMATWIIVAYFFRYSSLAALASAVFAPIYYLMGHREAWYAENMIALSLVIMCILLVIRHKENTVRLLAGEESKIASKKSD